MVRTSYQEVDWEYVLLTHLCHGSNSHLDQVAFLCGTEEHPVRQHTVPRNVVLPDPGEYVDPPNACIPISMLPPMSCRERIGEIPTHSWYTDKSSWGNPPTWTAVTIQPNTDTIWMETGTNCSSQWLNLEQFDWLSIMSPGC